MKQYKYISLLISVLIALTSYSQQNFFQRGMASYYADKFEGRITASGEIYTQTKLTAAHQELPFGTFVKVTNLDNGNSVVVLVNDRGPYIGNRIIDISKKAAVKLDFVEKGLTEVSIEVVEQGNGADKLTDILNTDNKKTKGEYYKLRTSKYQPSGYGVQIASYAEIANLMRIADNINRSMKKELTIQVVNYQNSKAYRIIIGNFKSKEEANKYKTSLQKDYHDCFVVSF